MRLPPPVIALAAAVTQRALTRDAARPVAGQVVSAAVVTAASAALMGSAVRCFGRYGTTIDPFNPGRASSLVTAGPFAVTRNPMYVGMAGLLGAHTILRGSWRALPPLVAFVLVMDRVQIPAEEAALVGVFGADYDAYRARVGRWLGPF